MANVLIGYRNWIDECTLAGGSYQASLPRSNLQNIQRTKVARTANATTANTQFQGVFAKDRALQLWRLDGTNCGLTAQYRLRLYSDAGLTTTVYDSGWIDVFPAGMFNALTWADENFWSGRPTSDDLNYLPRDITHVLTTRTLARAFKFEVNDSTNAAGYLDFGRPWIGDAWQPMVNMDYGAAIGHDDLSTASESVGGQRYATERDVRRNMALPLGWIGDDEAMQHVFAMQRIAKTVNEVVAVWDPDDPSNFARRAIRGHLRQLNPLTHPHHQLNATSFELEELL